MNCGLFLFSDSVLQGKEKTISNVTLKSYRRPSYHVMSLFEKEIGIITQFARTLCLVQYISMVYKHANKLWIVTTSVVCIPPYLAYHMFHAKQNVATQVGQTMAYEKLRKVNQFVLSL